MEKHPCPCEDSATAESKVDEEVREAATSSPRHPNETNKLQDDIA